MKRKLLLALIEYNCGGPIDPVMQSENYYVTAVVSFIGKVKLKGF